MGTLHLGLLMNEIKGGGQATLCDLERGSNRSTASRGSMVLFKQANSEKEPGHDEGTGGKAALVVKA